jgi:hypothetical protein
MMVRSPTFMVYPKTEIRSNSRFETQGLQATATKKGVYTEEKRENAPVKHSHGFFILHTSQRCFGMLPPVLVKAAVLG